MLVVHGSAAVDAYDFRCVCLRAGLAMYVSDHKVGRLTMPPASRRRAARPSSPDMMIFGMAVTQMEAKPMIVTRRAKAPAKAQ